MKREAEPGWETTEGQDKLDSIKLPERPAVGENCSKFRNGFMFRVRLFLF